MLISKLKNESCSADFSKKNSDEITENSCLCNLEKTIIAMITITANIAKTISRIRSILAMSPSPSSVSPLEDAGAFS
jgi:hypothetical protein